jgi:hypothetical protein
MSRELASSEGGRSKPVSGRSPSEAARTPPCRPSQLRTANGIQVSAATGQNPLSFVLTNRSSKRSVVDGYPTIALLDTHGKRLRFGSATAAIRWSRHVRRSL